MPVQLVRIGEDNADRRDCIPQNDVNEFRHIYFVDMKNGLIPMVCGSFVDMAA